MTEESVTVMNGWYHNHIQHLLDGPCGLGLSWAATSGLGAASHGIRPQNGDFWPQVLMLGCFAHFRQSSNFKVREKCPHVGQKSTRWINCAHFQTDPINTETIIQTSVTGYTFIIIGYTFLNRLHFLRLRLHFPNYSRLPVTGSILRDWRIAKN